MKQNKAKKSKKSSTPRKCTISESSSYNTSAAGYSALANAVLCTAVDDYESILIHNIKLRLEQEALEREGKPRTMTEKQIRNTRYPSKDDSEASLERFFRSPDFQLFVGAVSASLDLSGEDVIKIVKRHALNRFAQKQKARKEATHHDQNADRE